MIFPVAGVLIAVILALLLRSLVAPLYLMVAVVLGFFSYDRRDGARVPGRRRPRRV